MDNGSEEIVERLAFRRDWLSSIGVSASSAALITVRGDSMFPIISDGDLVMIDTSRTVPQLRRPRQIRRGMPEIFVLEIEGDLRLKWVDRPAPDQLVLHSENTRLFQPEYYRLPDSALRVIGKVAWWGHAVAG